MKTQTRRGAEASYAALIFYRYYTLCGRLVDTELTAAPNNPKRLQKHSTTIQLTTYAQRLSGQGHPEKLLLSSSSLDSGGFLLPCLQSPDISLVF